MAVKTSLTFTTFRNVVDGQLVDTQEHRHGINPASKLPSYDVPLATQKDLDTAVDAARTSFGEWSQTSAAERKQLVLKYADAIENERSGFVTLLTMEQGKPLHMAEYEFGLAVRWIREMAEIDVPEEVIEDSADRITSVRYTPICVMAAIVPWNYPILLATGKIAPALLTGNTIIIKPSPFTPYCGLKLAELAIGIFYPGVVQCLSGDDHLGPWITSHPGIDKISFAGSTATGKLRVTLELGGNDPAIIFPDVDIAKTVPEIAFYAFLNSGQTCLCVKRIYVHESIYGKFREALVQHVKTLKTGDGTLEGVSHGPLQNAMQYERVKGFFAEVKAQELKIAIGGEIEPSDGYFITPTIIDNPPEESRIVEEEPFGPIVPILSWKTEDEVVGRANNTKMGFGASVWSSNTAETTRIARRLEAGTVRVNNHFDLSPKTPFGGVKESGIGVEWGSQGMRAYCNIQSIVVKKD
ncbi:Aldehyde/histidinol dehydrogenase [Leptodontidium sp. MPI-SDFR-AT-0119]|nr:Aldehyde/histidinol dehydrogenase [Leptodontidium sp. MPI-SDFR-AT-0119]